jgi:hypothetical protein
MIHLIVVLAVIGLLYWLVVTYIPMPPLMLRAISIVAVICVVFFLLESFGLWPARDIPVPQLGGR